MNHLLLDFLVILVVYTFLLSFLIDIENVATIMKIGLFTNWIE